MQSINYKKNTKKTICNQDNEYKKPYIENFEQRSHSNNANEYKRQNEDSNENQNSLKISIIYLRKEKQENYVFKVLPFNKEIIRSINDIYSLRASLVLEFPFYYVEIIRFLQ